jgi:two-component system sensor histidine kinase KdpD
VRIGVIGIDRDRPGPLFTPDERRLLDALIDQAAVAIERVRLAGDIDEVRVQAETERLRSTLLSSISHDLRTPLASILGSITALRDSSRHYDQTAQDVLLATAQDEAERLNRFVGNLLDMTRLEGGSLEVHLELVDLGEIVETALRRAQRMLARHRIEMNLADNLPLINVDAVLFEQALFNMLDNAAKYSPPESLVRIDAWIEDGKIRVAVEDEGEGVPPDQLERIFDKFYRVKEGDARPAGTGLGLSICRGFIERMGGRIWASNRADRPGARFTVELPMPETRPLPSEQESLHTSVR